MLSLENLKKVDGRLIIEGFYLDPLGRLISPHNGLMTMSMLEGDKLSESDLFIVQTRYYTQVLDGEQTILEEYPETTEGLEKAITYILDNGEL